MTEDILSNRLQNSLVHEAPKRYVAVLWLTTKSYNISPPINALTYGKSKDNVRDEFGNDADVLQSTLCVRNAHDAVQKVDDTQSARVVVPNK